MIGMTETAGLDRIRARSFGAAGADYDKYRPRYPDQLVDDVVAVLPGRAPSGSAGTSPIARPRRARRRWTPSWSGPSAAVTSGARAGQRPAVDRAAGQDSPHCRRVAA